MDRLAAKVTFFFQMVFVGAVKQFVAQGYAPPEADANFIDCSAALLEYPSEAFDL